MKTNHRQSKVLPIEGCQTDGYMKVRDRKLNKFYIAMFTFGGLARGARKKFRTATAALDYGEKLVERYSRYVEYVKAAQVVVAEAA